MKKVSLIALVIIFAFSVVGYAGQVQVPGCEIHGVSANSAEALTYFSIKNVGTISQSITYEFFDFNGNSLDVSLATSNIRFNNYGAGTLDLTDAASGKVYHSNIPANSVAYVLMYTTTVTGIGFSVRITVEQYNANDYGVIKSLGFVKHMWIQYDSNGDRVAGAGWGYPLNGGLEF
ncbi:MAG TPA: hypothetical protein PKW95_18600 [bacterium]|nr:hypothetical protein [bacterium]